MPLNNADFIMKQVYRTAVAELMQRLGLVKTNSALGKRNSAPVSLQISPERGSAGANRFRGAVNLTRNSGGGGSPGGAASPQAIAAALSSNSREDLNAFNESRLSPLGSLAGSPDRSSSNNSSSTRHPSKRALHNAVRNKRFQVFTSKKKILQ